MPRLKERQEVENILYPFIVYLDGWKKHESSNLGFILPNSDISHS